MAVSSSEESCIVFKPEYDPHFGSTSDENFDSEWERAAEMLVKTERTNVKNSICATSRCLFLTLRVVVEADSNTFVSSIDNLILWTVH